LNRIEKQRQQFEAEWKSKDESENFAQRHDQEIIKSNKRREVEAEIKLNVFGILQDELTNLILAVEKDKGKKGKKGKGAKGKKGKKDKGKKGKKEKDLTANRTMESLVEELVKAGILQKYSHVPLNSVVGNMNLLENFTSKDIVVTPTIAEVQRVLTEYCVLPLGVPVSTEPEAPPIKYPKIASILLFGPSGVGKTMLVQALASEIGAQLFNLSPRNTAGQFVGKANVTKMVHMVFKVARAQAPAIIYIDGAEMIFAKKVPKDDTSDPKRIKKDLAKSIKLIKDHAERVILIATTNKPWDGDAKAMLPLFDKALYVPKPDYSSRFTMWKEFITRKAPEYVSSINISLLTRMSEGVSTGTIEMICNRVLTTRRIRHVRTRPLSTLEFIELLLDLPPANPEEPKMFKVPVIDLGIL
jgi:SpoVK/Ycf46/Vps4 family AAA+-type ATPase